MQVCTERSARHGIALVSQAAPPTPLTLMPWPDQQQPTLLARLASADPHLSYELDMLSTRAHKPNMSLLSLTRAKLWASRP